jgi:hypothetical protein
MPFHKIEVTEYECAKCSYKWINWINGNEGPKPRRCAKCKRWDWEEGYLSHIEKELRRDLLKIEENEINHPTVEGTGFYSYQQIFAPLFLVYTLGPQKRNMIVLNPICYLGPYDHSRHPFFHKGTCIDRVNCGPGWIPKPDKPGGYEFDKICNEMVRKEEELRHESMQHIIDSREGIMNTTSKHYEYFGEKKRTANRLTGFDL